MRFVDDKTEELLRDAFNYGTAEKVCLVSQGDLAPFLQRFDLSELTLVEDLGPDLRLRTPFGTIILRVVPDGWLKPGMILFVDSRPMPTAATPYIAIFDLAVR
jgi:hypothetical protein